MNCLKHKVLKIKTIAPGDMELYQLVDTAEEAVNYLLTCHRFGFRTTVK